MHTLSTAITSHALDDSDDEWPHVILPHFHQKTKEINDLLGSNLIMFAPLVQFEDQNEWLDWIRKEQANLFVHTVRSLPCPYFSLLDTDTFVSETNELFFLSLGIVWSP